MWFYRALRRFFGALSTNMIVEAMVAKTGNHPGEGASQANEFHASGRGCWVSQYQALD